MSAVSEPTARSGYSGGEVELLLALADDELAMGHRHAEWIGIGPFLEEDLAFTSIAQDELGHARALFELLTTGGGRRATDSNTNGADTDGADLDAADTEAADRLAYDRAPGDYRCAWLVELPCHEWADAFVRHVLYDLAESVRWEALAGSSDARLAGVARRALAEESFHTTHAVPLARRLIEGTPESRRRIDASLGRLLPLAVGLFEPTSGEADALASGLTTASAAEQATRWRAAVEDTMAGTDAIGAWPSSTGEGGRRGRRSEHFGAMHAEMVAVRVLDPQAAW